MTHSRGSGSSYAQKYFNLLDVEAIGKKNGEKILSAFRDGQAAARIAHDELLECVKETNAFMSRFYENDWILNSNGERIISPGDFFETSDSLIVSSRTMTKIISMYIEVVESLEANISGLVSSIESQNAYVDTQLDNLDSELFVIADGISKRTMNLRDEIKDVLDLSKRSGQETIAKEDKLINPTSIEQTPFTQNSEFASSSDLTSSPLSLRENPLRKKKNEKRKSRLLDSLVNDTPSSFLRELPE